MLSANFIFFLFQSVRSANVSDREEDNIDDIVASYGGSQTGIAAILSAERAVTSPRQQRGLSEEVPLYASSQNDPNSSFSSCFNLNVSF